MKKNRLLVSALSMCLVVAQMPIGAFAAVPDNSQAVYILSESNLIMG